LIDGTTLHTTELTVKNFAQGKQKQMESDKKVLKKKKTSESSSGMATCARLPPLLALGGTAGILVPSMARTHNEQAFDVAPIT